MKKIVYTQDATFISSITPHLTSPPEGGRNSAGIRLVSCVQTQQSLRHLRELVVQKLLQLPCDEEGKHHE